MATVGSDRPRYQVSSLVEHHRDDAYRTQLTVEMSNFTMKIEQPFDRTGGALSTRSYVAESKLGDILVSREVAPPPNAPLQLPDRTVALGPEGPGPTSSA